MRGRTGTKDVMKLLAEARRAGAIVQRNQRGHYYVTFGEQTIMVGSSHTQAGKLRALRAQLRKLGLEL